MHILSLDIDRQARIHGGVGGSTFIEGVGVYVRKNYGGTYQEL